MAPVRDRTLPNRVNPFMLGPEAPSYEELVDRRRLGQTDLTVRNSQVGTSSATQPENLGKFDYAHLRVQIPETHFGIWGPKGSPASYFLMRRSSDGYISATGMFKAAFPFSEVADEEAERRYIGSLPTTSSDQTAGNVWIPPTHALELAEEYKITPWIGAMLDNKKIEKNPASKDQPPKAISPPPKFLLPQASLAAPAATRATRFRRSASPNKLASPRKTVATPRNTKASKAASKAGSQDSHTKAANKSLQQALKQAATAGDSEFSTPEPSESRDSESPEDAKKEPQREVKKDARTDELNGEAKATETVESTVKVKDDVETTETHVEVEMPAGLPELPLPEDGAAMIAKAKEMVEAAIAQDKAALKEAKIEKTLPKRAKRKAEEVEEKEGVESDEAPASPVAKKAKVETELMKEKVKTRALIGISATLAIGAMIPYLSTFL